MSEKAFTMASNQYCGSCGSFDLAIRNPDWLNRRILKAQPAIFCFGCGKSFSERVFTRNVIRTIPLTFDDFFFQTNLRNRQLEKRQIRPLTQALGVSLIVVAVTGLLLFELPSDQLRNRSTPQIEWSEKISLITEVDVVKKLQHQFDQLLKAK